MQPEAAQRFAAAWMSVYERGGRTKDVADALGLSDSRSILYRRKRVESFLGIRLPSMQGYEPLRYTPQHAEHIQVDGCVVICSDVHLWPEHQPFAWFCLVEAVKQYKPKEVWINGDLMDFPSISRFPRRQWEERPTAAEEIEWAGEQMQDLTKACDKAGATKRITRGNHDDRFELYLSKNAPGIEGLPGTTTKELYAVFDGWQLYHSLVVNDSSVVKHVWHGGIHSAYNNVVRSGKTIITGHTHKLNIRPWGDYNGVRFAVETGFVGEIQGPQFAYVDGNPTDWHPGFMVTWWDADGLASYEAIHTHSDRARVNGKWLHREDYPCSRSN